MSTNKVDASLLKLDLPQRPKWGRHNSEGALQDMSASGDGTSRLTPSGISSPGGSACVSPAGSCSGAGGSGLTIECSPRMGSPRIQSLSLELLASPSARTMPLEEAWKGEILPDFLFLGDRVTASDIDRLRSLQITHVLNATEDIANFFETEGQPRLQYHRCPIRDQSDAGAAMSAQFAACCSFLDNCRSCGGRALVHCRAGVSRSATIVIGYLMHAEKLDLRTALHHVDSRRFVQPNSGFIDFLLSLEQDLHGKSSMSAADFGYTQSAHGWRGDSTPRAAASEQMDET